METQPLSGKTFCVIGGTSGMGFAIAEACVRQGARVFATGTSERSVEQARKALGYGDVTFTVLDIQDQPKVEAYGQTFATLDALINCAGASSSGDQLNPQVAATMISLNLTGIYHVCIAMHAALKEAGGCVVNFGSITAYYGSKESPAYAAAKGGIITLTRSLASAWRPDGIRVNVISPGYIKTRMSSAKAEQSARPNKRWGSAEDVVGPTLFLCSKDASFVTGADLLVDGGFMATATNFF